MNTKMKELKEEQKKRAADLKENKNGHKNSQRQGDAVAADTYLCEVFSLKKEYRHKHIAYSMLRGRKYEEIERTCRDNNKPDFDYIDKIKASYAEEAHEDVCAGA